MDYYGKKMQINSKSNPADIVTAADIKSQKVIVQSLLRSMVKKGYKKEEIGFIAEENFVKAGAHTFIIDPLDGTSSYVLGLDRFAISIAYAYKGKILAGIAYNPVKKIFYIAEKNKGAYKIEGAKKEKLLVRKIPIQKSLISINPSSNKARAVKMFQIAINLIPRVIQVREQGSAVLSSVAVAENKFQANINGRCKFWDIAAVKIILEEAKGAILDWSGKIVECDLKNIAKDYSIIAGHPALLKQLLPYINTK